MAYSYTSLDCYAKCPRKYKFHYIDKIEEVKGKSLLKGIQYHKTIETGTASTEQEKKILEWTNQKVQVKGTQRKNKKLTINWEHPYLIEKEAPFAWTKDKKPCSFDDTNAYFRGKIDVVESRIDQDAFQSWKNGEVPFLNVFKEIQITDWKTGKNYKSAGFKQLKTYSLYFFYLYPNVSKITCYLRNIDTQEEFKKEVIKEDVPEIEEDLSRRIFKFESGVSCRDFHKVVTPLCNYCGYNTLCSTDDSSHDSSYDSKSVLCPRNVQDINDLLTMNLVK